MHETARASERSDDASPPGVPTPAGRTPRPPVRLLVLGGAVVLVAALIAVVLLVVPRPADRPELQRTLQGLVAGSDRLAPGVTAIVLGPHRTWSGAAGTADVTSGVAMRPDSRMRIQSNSKTWLLVAVLQLVRERRMTLDDTVERWLPGLLPYGARITVRQLLLDTSGLIDDNDLTASRAAFVRYLARVKDEALRRRLSGIAARLGRDPATAVDPIWLIRFAAWQPLVGTPGAAYHHSNIGWNVAGLIAEKVAGASLATLLQRRIIRPLRLDHTTVQPQGAIRGPHATGYWRGPDGRDRDATAWTYGKGADGAIVTDAQDEAGFVAGIVDDRLHVRRAFLDLLGASPTDLGPCPGNAFLGEGAGAASRSYVYYDHAGRRVAVLLLNGLRAASAATGEPRAERAVRALFCAA